MEKIAESILEYELGLNKSNKTIENHLITFEREKNNKQFYIDELERPNGLFIMTKDDIEKCAECAALAYSDYPLFNYVTNGVGNVEAIKKIFQSSVYSIKDDVIGFYNNENADAVAIFAPPHYKGSKTIPFLLHGGIKLIYLAPFSTFAKLIKYEGHAMKLKKEFTNHECWYLYNVTVKPKEQGKGYCSQVLRPMFNYFDKTEQDCYLETHSEENVKLYEHYGFDLLDISFIPKSNVKHYAMLRKHR